MTLSDRGQLWKPREANVHRMASTAQPRHAAHTRSPQAACDRHIRGCRGPFCRGIGQPTGIPPARLSLKKRVFGETETGFKSGHVMQTQRLVRI